MSCNITVSVSDDFAKEAKRLAKKHPNFKQDYKDFLESHTVFFFTFYFDLYMDSKRICKRNRLRLLIKWKMKDIIKKSFFSFLPSHPHTCGWNALFIGVSSGEGKCEGSAFALTIPHTLISGWNVLFIGVSMVRVKKRVGEDKSDDWAMGIVEVIRYIIRLAKDNAFADWK